MEYKFDIYFMALGENLSNQFRTSIIFTEGKKTIKSFEKDWDKAEQKVLKNLNKDYSIYQAREKKEDILQETIRLLVKQGYDLKVHNLRFNKCLYI